jgi:hypothetical protein
LDSSVLEQIPEKQTGEAADQKPARQDEQDPGKAIVDRQKKTPNFGQLIGSRGSHHCASRRINIMIAYSFVATDAAPSGPGSDLPEVIIGRHS